ncbi:PREDICTED: sperm-associated antigen 5, partial [Pygoscelis adeliae]
PTAATGTSVTPVPTAATGTSVTPVPTAVTGTFMTPRDLRERSMNTSAGSFPCAKDSAAETDSLLWHCPREQLKSLPRAELEGRLESTLIIIEALSLQLRDWQESQRLLPGVGPAEQRDVLTQTDVTHPKGEEEIYRNLYLELRRKMEALQRQRGAEQDLQRELELTTAGTVRLGWLACDECSRPPLATLQERSLQYKELMDSHQRLREEQTALGQELESTKAELLDLQLKRDKVSWCSTDIAESKMRLQELADCLRAALQEEDDAPTRSRAWTPAPRTPGWQTPRRAWTPACRTPACRTPYCAGGSFVGSVLKAVSGKEPEDGLLESVKELRAVVSDLAMLSSRIQELEQSEFKALQREISDLQLRLETVTAESQEKMDAQAAAIAKLNKALRGKLENEKELQDVVKQQEEKMLQLIDKSGEVTRLKGEVSQLKRSLQRAETEAKVLWEEMRGQEPKVDAAYVQERVLLRQEVDKLRLLLLEKEGENLLLSDKYLEQVRGLELRLHHAQKVLRTHEEMQEKMKEVLSAVPDVAAGCQELHSLLRYLGLKTASGSSIAAALSDRLPDGQLGPDARRHLKSSLGTDMCPSPIP